MNFIHRNFVNKFLMLNGKKPIVFDGNFFLGINSDLSKWNFGAEDVTLNEGTKQITFNTTTEGSHSVTYTIPWNNPSKSYTFISGFLGSCTALNCSILVTLYDANNAVLSSVTLKSNDASKNSWASQIYVKKIVVTFTVTEIGNFIFSNVRAL